MADPRRLLDDTAKRYQPRGVMGGSAMAVTLPRHSARVIEPGTAASIFITAGDAPNVEEPRADDVVA